MSVVSQWMVLSSSGGAGRVDEAEGDAMYEGRLDCVEFTVGRGTVESLWIKIEGQTSKEDVITGGYYRLLARMMNYL